MDSHGHNCSECLFPLRQLSKYILQMLFLYLFFITALHVPTASTTKKFSTASESPFNRDPAPNENNADFIDRTLGTSTLPSRGFSRYAVKRLRRLFFIGENDENKNLTGGSFNYWSSQLQNQEIMNITTKDGLKLYSWFASTEGANKTIILFGGMGEVSYCLLI